MKKFFVKPVRSMSLRNRTFLIRDKDENIIYKLKSKNTLHFVVELTLYDVNDSSKLKLTREARSHAPTKLWFIKTLKTLGVKLWS